MVYLPRQIVAMKVLEKAEKRLFGQHVNATPDGTQVFQPAPRRTCFVLSDAEAVAERPADVECPKRGEPTSTAIALYSTSDPVAPLRFAPGSARRPLRSFRLHVISR